MVSEAEGEGDDLVTYPVIAAVITFLFTATVAVIIIVVVICCVVKKTKSSKYHTSKSNYAEKNPYFPSGTELNQKI